MATRPIFYPGDIIRVRKSKDGKNESKKNVKEEEKDELYGTVARVWHHEFETIPFQHFGMNDEMGVGRGLKEGEYGIELHPVSERIIVDHSRLELIDRDFRFGYLCKMKSNNKDGSSSSVPEGMSGIVMDVESEFELRHVITDQLIGKKIPAEKIRSAEYVSFGDIVLYKNWVGTVHNKFTEALCETDEHQSFIRYGTTLNKVDFHYGYTEREGCKSDENGPAYGRFQYHPRFVELRQTVIMVDWLAKNGKLTPEQSKKNPMPKPLWTELEELIIVKPYLKPKFELDSQVAFSSKAAAKEYNFEPSRHIQRSNFGTKKAQCDVMRVAARQSIVTVLWQDGRTTKHPSTDLHLHYLDFEEIEIWKGLHVLYTPINEAQRGAVVESANFFEGTVNLHLYNNEEQSKGIASTENDPVTASILEIKTTHSRTLGRTIRYGSIVLLTDSEQAFVPPLGNTMGVSSFEDFEWGDHLMAGTEAALAQMGGEMMSKRQQGELNIQRKPRVAADAHEIDWFGFVIDLQTDGMIVVQLPAGRKISVSMDKVALLNDDFNDEYTYPNDFPEDDDDDSSSCRSWGTDPFEKELKVPWTTEDGATVENANADDWEDDEMGENDIEKKEIQTNDEAGPEDIPSNEVESSEALFATIKTNKESSVPVFEVLEQAPNDHSFYSLKSNPSKKFLSHLRKEYEILQSSLPDTIFVKAYEDRTDLLRVLILGSKGTPYEDTPVLIDFYLKSTHPLDPPKAHFHSWSNGHGRMSPNLYEEGTVCLSLLNTWSGESSERWDAKKSTLLQIFVSIQALVLVSEPYFTEAGYESKQRTEEVNLFSRQYSEKAFILSRRFICHVLQYPISGFEQDLKKIYTDAKLQEIMKNMRKLIDDQNINMEVKKNESSSWSDHVTFSNGGRISLQKIFNELEKAKESVK